MLVVIGIICLIAAVLTPSLLGQMSRARYKAAQLQLDTLSSAVEEFHSDTGRFPTQTESLGALVKEPPDVTGWAGPYLRDRKVLNDPWNRPVRYVPDTAGASFYVESYAADGKAGGSGTDHDLRSPSGS